MATPGDEGPDPAHGDEPGGTAGPARPPHPRPAAIAGMSFVLVLGSAWSS